MAKKAINKYYRTLEDVLYTALFPYSGVNDPSINIRHLAISEVLTRLPETDFDKLLDLSLTFHWFIPDIRVRGLIEPFPVNNKPRDNQREYAKLLYLSPILEKAAWDIVVAIVAHELAHIALEHKLMTQSEEEYDIQEDEVFELMNYWGFEREAKKMLKVNKWRSTVENT